MTGLISPVPGHPITQGFDGVNVNEPSGWLKSDSLGPREAHGGTLLQPWLGATYRRKLHKAVDISCAIGTPIVAPQAGIVVATGAFLHFADGSPDGEIYTLLRIHKDAVSQTILLFTHLSKHVATVGQRVAQGGRLALSGASGRITGPHLHWEVRTGPATANPMTSWGRTWTRWNPARCMTGHDLAGRSFLVPN